MAKLDMQIRNRVKIELDKSKLSIIQTLVLYLLHNRDYLNRPHNLFASKVNGLLSFLLVSLCIEPRIAFL